MANYKMTIQYEGTRYKGWQEQNHTENTIQGKIRRILERMTDEEIDLQGSGRTDAGVHAIGQVAHFHTKDEYETDEIKDYVNQYLPEDIAVTEVIRASDRFHARLHAIEKTYEYRIWCGKKPDVFVRRYVSVLDAELDVEAMKQAASYLEGTHDFKSFCGNSRMKKSTVRCVKQIMITQEGREVRIRCTGNGFLQHMVRILVGTLVEVGLQERRPEDMDTILTKRDRSCAGRMMPASGLTMVEVKYS